MSQMPFEDPFTDPFDETSPDFAPISTEQVLEEAAKHERALEARRKRIDKFDDALSPERVDLGAMIGRADR